MDEEAFALGGDVRQSVIDSGRTDVMTWLVAKYFFNIYLSKLRSRELGQDEEQAIILTLFPSNLFILSNLLNIEQLPKPYHIWRSSVQTHKTTGNIFFVFKSLHSTPGPRRLMASSHFKMYSVQLQKSQYS